MPVGLEASTSDVDMQFPRFVYRRDAAPKDGPESLFVTPLFKRRLAIATPEFLAHVKSYVLDLEKRDAGLKLSNVGGWHSTGDLFDTKDEALRGLAAELLGLAAEMSYFQISDQYPDCIVEPGFFGGSWANVSRHGDFNRPHVHPGVVWSGVFYVDIGDRDPQRRENGCIEFMDPRPGNLHGGKRVVSPEAGQALLFPSWLCHYVNPFFGRGERISIAFNTTARVSPLG
jgi:uncharacterized protein (TIGR02466 family)